MRYLLTLVLCINFVSLINCQTSSQYSWTKYFETENSKFLGIWPHNDRFLDIDRLKELKQVWGFDHALLARSLGLEYYVQLREAGFDSTKIMKQIKQDTYRKNVEDFPAMWAYFIDEPGELGENLTIWSGITDWIKNKLSNSKIVVSGYKRDSFLIEYVNTIADYTMFSSYKHWLSILGIWFSLEDPDQRSDWQDMRNLFGDKFAFTWIGAHRDLDEYNDLLRKASDLNLSGVYLYHLEPANDEVDDSNLESFAEAAARNGFSNKFYQEIRDLYIDGAFINRKLVGPVYFSNKPDSYDHTTLVFQNYTVSNNRIEDYFAESKVIAGDPYNFTIPKNRNASFNSNREIHLKPGFHSQHGSTFRAYIGDD